MNGLAQFISGPLQGLIDPTDGHRRELVAPVRIELLDRFEQTKIAFLDQILPVESTSLVAPSAIPDEALIGCCEAVECGPARLATNLNEPGKLSLFLSGEQRCVASVALVEGCAIYRQRLLLDEDLYPFRRPRAAGGSRLTLLLVGPPPGELVRAPAVPASGALFSTWLACTPPTYEGSQAWPRSV